MIRSGACCHEVFAVVTGEFVMSINVSSEPLGLSVKSVKALCHVLGHKPQVVGQDTQVVAGQFMNLQLCGQLAPARGGVSGMILVQ